MSVEHVVLVSLAIGSHLLHCHYHRCHWHPQEQHCNLHYHFHNTIATIVLIQITLVTLINVSLIPGWFQLLSLNDVLAIILTKCF